MTLSPRIQFFILEALLIYAGFAIAAVLTPPDPYSQLLTAVVLLAVTVPVSYWLVYKRGLPV